MTQALAGVRIADFTTAHQGPWATQKLGDMGADVIKIERPGGEWSRDLSAGAGHDVDGESPFWLSANRSKRSVTLDLKADEGRAAALDVAAGADAVVENFRPGVMDRLGLAYDDVRAVNPEVVYVSASGFGSDGPLSDRPGQDLLMQALCGLTTAVGHADHPPMPVPFPLVDGHSAMQLAFKAMVALFHRERTGEGQHVEVNLLDSALDTQCQAFTVERNVDHDFERSATGIGQKYLPAPYGLYETADGHVAISMTPLDRLADVLDLPALAEYSKREAFTRRDEIKRTLAETTRERTTDDLLATLLDAEVWAARVDDFDGAAANPQVRHNEMLVEVPHPTGGTFETTGIPGSLSATPGEIQRGPPAPGEHTAEVLGEVGYTDSEIDALAAAGVTDPGE
ncbi:CaiB/BaiF CoA transferase family protein [Haloarcula litorea]|uniref:CaiB/BaiF CoA transferase family protein n=1 Tax=Haloarcula litorea TaxID=3032579 RepID=UPI0023E77457|nr:CaiB/BaiF CoA-transferase family protein [Halomicroarcula sp. GDY20]